MKPRERLMALGPGALTDAELVAVLLRTGTAGRDVVQLATELVTRHGGLDGLFDCTVEELLAVNGIGAAKGTTLAAVMELARRYYRSRVGRNGNRFGSPEEVFQYLRHHVDHDGSERFCVLYLNPQGELLRFETLFRGNHSSAPVFVSEIMKLALKCHASDLIVAHNHPSGNCQPSPEDLAITRRLREAAGLLDMTLRDHLIFSADSYVSLAERGDV